MIDQKEFDRRVKYNVKLFNQQAEVNEFTPSTYYLFDKEPKELSSINYGKLYHDIFAAAVCGTLVLSNLNEKDSVEMRHGKITKVELKTSYLRTKGVYLNTKGNIYVGDRTPLSDHIRASFNKSYYQEHDIPVYLCVCDATDKWKTDFVGAWQMDGKTAHEIIDPMSTKVISLRRFIKDGKRKNTKVNSIGYTNWIKTMKNRLPIKKTTTLRK